MDHEFDEMDVTDWDPAGDEQIGSKPKQWLFQPGTEQRWLWKPRTFNPARGGDRYPKGDDWAEKVATELARGLGLPCAEVQLARRGDDVGVLSRSFTDRPGEPSADLIPGNVLLGAAVDGYHPSAERGGHGYTVDNVKTVLDAVYPPIADPVLTTAFDWFVAYLALDAWIGNTDRHHQNWGTLRTPGTTGEVLAPSFDHASSLGFLLSDEERTQRVATADVNFTVQAFAQRAETPFEGRPHPAVVAAEGCAAVRPQVVEELVGRLSEQEEVGVEVLARVPGGRMSPAAREFAASLLVANASAFLSQVARTLES